MVAVEKRVWTPEEYFAFEQSHDQRYELLDGMIRLMSGASAIHNEIVMNTSASLHGQLRKRPCKVYVTDMRVKLSGQRSYVYPDVVVVCGNPILADNRFDTLLNPTLLIEVLSPSTEAYDRGKKAEHFRTMETLQEYLLIAQERTHMEHYRRVDGSWVVEDVNDADAIITLQSIECSLALADVYEKVDFSQAEPPAPDWNTTLE